MRNKKGQFTKGHESLVNNPKSKTSGRFVKSKTVEEKRLRKNKLSKEWQRNNPEKRKKYYKENRERYLKIGLNNSYVRRYGITLQDKEEMLIKQNCQCLIYQRIIDMSASVDHNHETGKIRGILCRNCNIGLGNFQDNIAILQNAINYLNLKGGE